MTEVRSTLTKSQKEAQEMSDCVTKLAEEIKQLKGSRAREETVRAKVLERRKINWCVQRLNPCRKELRTRERIRQRGGTQ